MGDQHDKKQLTDSNSGQDFISHLPQPIKDNILGRLSTEQAIRTCVLSKEWRNAWHTVPNLAIFEKHDEELTYDCSEYVDMLLSNHKGPIHEFTLHMYDPDFDDLDRWINILGSKGVKGLSLKLDIVEDHEIPASFFSRLLDLTNLELRGGMLDMPQAFGGFKLLRYIELVFVTFIGGNLEKLVSSCPLLEDLKLVNECECLGNIVIRSQSLKRLRVLGEFKQFRIVAPNLFAFYISHPGSNKNLKMVKGEFQAIFNGLDQENVICCKFMVRYDINTMLMKLPIQLNHLNKMFITIDLSNEGDHRAALCFFKISPRLQDLYVKFTAEEDSLCGSFWKSENAHDLFRCLKTVTINSMNSGGTVYIVEFVEFILRTAPVLENMIIKDLGVEAVLYTLKTPSFLLKVSQDRMSQEGMRLDLMAIFEVLKFPRLSNKTTVEFRNSETSTGSFV